MPNMGIGKHLHSSVSQNYKQEQENKTDKILKRLCPHSSKLLERQLAANLSWTPRRHLLTGAYVTEPILVTSVLGTVRIPPTCTNTLLIFRWPRWLKVSNPGGMAREARWLVDHVYQTTLVWKTSGHSVCPFSQTVNVCWISNTVCDALRASLDYTMCLWGRGYLLTKTLPIVPLIEHGFSLRKRFHNLK